MNTIVTINPFDLSQIKEYEAINSIELNNVLEKSNKAFYNWRKTTFNERKKILKNVAIILRRDKENLAKLITIEMGKVIVEARAEIEKCATTLEYYVDNGEEYLKDTIIKSSATNISYISYEPIGIIFAIMPWNYPFWQVIRYAVPCIFSGNVTILKHAPNVFGCAEAIEKIFLEAGLPEYVFKNVIINIDLVEQIISSNYVQGITLTGSEKAGSNVAMIAGKNIKKTVMELGGSDPFIILEDADLEKAIKIAVQSRMMNAGQACICAKRFIIIDKIKNDFIDKFIQELNKIKIGNPLEENTNMGPMARLDLANIIDKQAKESVKLGAKILSGGNKDNCFYSPTLMINSTKGMPVFDEEVFGPLANLIFAKDEQEAILIANNSRYGLGAALWTKDLDKAKKLSTQIETGSVFVNALVHSDPRLPFGGIKKSGYGRELSELGIKEFMNAKTIYINN